MIGGALKKVITVLFVCLTLAACLDTGAALKQPATLTPTPQPTDNPTATEPAPMQCKVTAGALHVRSGAGVEYAVIGYLRAGEIVTVKTQRGTWFEIGADRWVHSKYCEVKP